MIAQARRAAGLTQQQLADQASVSVGAVRDLEQGRTSQPRHATADALALVLGLNVSQAGTGTEPRLGQDAGPVASGLSLGVLGPLAVRRNGNRVDLGAGRQRAVLGLLAVHPGTALHRETIVDAIWGYEPPASAIAMVQSYASRLRRLLGQEVLASDGTSYWLELAAPQLDTLEFVRLANLAKNAVTTGDPATACRLYDRALQLWRGDPLADVSALRGHPALTELAQLRTSTILDHAAAAAVAGCPELVLPQLRELALRDALDERVHARLMLILAACGQQAAALSVFDQLRQRLAEELGITPGAELADAQLRILRGQVDPPQAAAVTNGAVAPGPVAQTHRAGPRQLPAAVAHFTGRARELAVLSELLDQASDGSGAAVISVIAGMAGVGKTALAVHWAHQITDAFPDGQLYVNLRGFGPTGPPATPAEAVVGFLDALGVRPERIPAALEAQAALYRSLIASQRLLIVLDNVRDEEQVRPLLPGSPGCLVIVTSRKQLTGLAAAEGARLLTLDVLTDSDARAMLGARLGSPRAAADPDAAAEIAALCARLPLALAITAARAAAQPRFTLAMLADELRETSNRLEALDAGDPAVSARTVFAWSYRQLTPAAARMFRLLALHPGPDISALAAASLAGVQAGQARQHLTELARAHLATELSPGRYVLHDLLRAYATELAQATDDQACRDNAIGRVLDHYLHTADAASCLLHPLRDPLILTQPESGVTHERMADAQQALSWFRIEHKVLLASISLAAAAGLDSKVWQLPCAMSEYLDRSGHWHDCAAILQRALEAATRLDDPAGLAIAHRVAAVASHRLADYGQARAHLETSIALCRQFGDRIGEARAHLGFSFISQRQGRLAESLGHEEQALRLFQATGHQVGQAHVLNSLGWSHIQLGNPQEGRSLCRQALSLHRELGDRTGQAYTWDSVGYAEYQLGRLTEAARCYRSALSILPDAGGRFEEAAILIHLGDACHAAGDLPQAGDAWRQALGILEDLGHPDAEEVRAKIGQLSSGRTDEPAGEVQGPRTRR